MMTALIRIVRDDSQKVHGCAIEALSAKNTPANKAMIGSLAPQGMNGVHSAWPLYGAGVNF